MKSTHGSSLWIDSSRFGDTGWRYKSLHDFTCGIGGDGPNALAVDAWGWVYGTLTEGGTSGDGVAFEILP